MNGNSLASTPKAWIQHQNQSSSTVSKTQPLNAGENKHNYKPAWGVGGWWIIHWIKKAARRRRTELDFLLVLSDFAGRATGKSSFLAVHGGQCSWLSVLACDCFVSLCFQHCYQHSRGTKSQPSLGFSNQLPRGSRHKPLLFLLHLA